MNLRGYSEKSNSTTNDAFGIKPYGFEYEHAILSNLWTIVGAMRTILLF